MALSTRAPDVRGRTGRKAGLGLVADLAVLPHFDRWERWRRGSAASALRELPDGVELVGVDEDTALVRMAPDGPWVCQGRQRCWHLRRDGTRVSASHGEVLAV
jgi:cyanophycinase